ncbi:ABC transporter permease [Hafnia alvei]|uniref:ABC transporter n=1 Tax=Hafnia alvei TaxID=569 RepID=A0ABD7Q6H7_HAFAL|nr:ABC transporter permease [Hafnia alvei]TBL69142.1 ABC transporter [Hafnia alvei]
MLRFISTAKSTSTLKELWLARYLVVQLIRRDLTVRYRQTWLGWCWALLNPAMSLLMYYAVFGVLVRLSPPDYQVPYIFILLSGIVWWLLFSSIFNAVSDSLQNNLQLIQKIYFPRLGLTFVGLGVCSVDFLLVLVLLLFLLLFNHLPVYGLRLLICLPICWLLTAGLAWGMGCAVAILKLRFRDFRHLIPLLLQALFYAAPVVYTPSLVPTRWLFIYESNPLVAILGLFRYALFSGPMPPLLGLFISTSGTFIIASIGYLTFMQYEAQVVDRG